MSGRDDWFIQLSRTASIFLALMLAALLQATPVQAHGEASLVVSPTVVAPGDVISLQGEEVEPGEEFTITLEGIKSQTVLGTVLVGDAEEFRVEFTVPADTEPGVYQVTAVSEEGETLTAELTVQGGASVAESTVPAEPSTELMQLDRSKTYGEWAVIGLVLLISAGLGLALVWVRGPKNTTAGG